MTTSNENVPSEPKHTIIDEIKTVSDKDQVLELEVKTNPGLQKVLYDAYYKELSKDVEIKGFRKGQAPRELIEPQIYNKIVERFLMHLYSLVVTALPAELKKQGIVKDAVLLEEPQLKGVDFKAVEIPATFKLELYYAPKPVLPDLDKFKIDMSDVKEDSFKVTDKEVEEFVLKLYEDWKAKTDKKTVSEFSEPSDKWVQTLKVPNVSTLKDLKEWLKKDLANAKKYDVLRRKVDETMHKIYHAIEISVPDTLKSKVLEAQKQALSEQLKSLGVTLEQYFKANKVDPKQFEEDVLHGFLDKIRSRVFWEMYIEENGIKIEDDAMDRQYVQQAVYHLSSHSQQQPSTTEILLDALMLKAQDHLLRRLGAPKDLLIVKEIDIEKKGDKQEGNKKKGSVKQKGDILIPEDAKI